MTSSDPRTRWTHDSELRCEWLDEQDRMDRLLRPLGARMLGAADLRRGERVIDIGCGTGFTTLEAWRAVRPRGSVTGLDISPQMIDRARERASSAEATVELVVSDVQNHAFERDAADVAISRFGVGHFVNTSAGFGNIASALRSGGRLVFTEWAPGEINEWMTLVDDIARRVWPHLPAAKTAPVHGPDFNDRDALSNAITSAGLVLDTLELACADLPIGQDVSDVLQWFETLPERHILDRVDDGDRQLFLAELIRELRERARPDGVYVRGTAWIAVCQKP
jgi:SAM-dependent methyltransferase